jgi:hypothetical protein
VARIDVLVARVPAPRRQGEIAAELAALRRRIRTVSSATAELLKPDGCVYVRTDAREGTRDTTFEVLQACFPARRMTVMSRPCTRGTQTRGTGTPRRSQPKSMSCSGGASRCAQTLVSPRPETQHATR